jgi:hypothetical protein
MIEHAKVPELVPSTYFYYLRFGFVLYILSYGNLLLDSEHFSELYDIRIFNHEGKAVCIVLFAHCN